MRAKRTTRVNGRTLPSPERELEQADRGAPAEAGDARTVMTPRALLTLPEVAQGLHLSVKAVRGLIARGDLPAFKVAGRLRVHPDELEAYLELSRVSLTEPLPLTPQRPAPGRPNPRGGLRSRL